MAVFSFLTFLLEMKVVRAATVGCRCKCQNRGDRPQLRTLASVPFFRLCSASVTENFIVVLQRNPPSLAFWKEEPLFCAKVKPRIAKRGDLGKKEGEGGCLLTGQQLLQELSLFTQFYSLGCSRPSFLTLLPPFLPLFCPSSTPPSSSCNSAKKKELDSSNADAHEMQVLVRISQNQFHSHFSSLGSSRVQVSRSDQFSKQGLTS